MKPNRRFFIKMIIAIFLISSAFIYQYQRNDELAYIEIQSQVRTNNRAINIIKDGSENLILIAENIIAKSNNQKPLVKTMREIKTTIRDFSTVIGRIQSEILVYDYEKLDRTNAKYIMPNDYYSTSPVKAYFDNDTAMVEFEKQWKETIEKLNKLCHKDIRQITDTSKLLSDEEIRDYFEQQNLTLKNNTTLLTQMIEKKGLNQILKYDVIHADALLTSLQSELIALEWVLLKNTIQILKSGIGKSEPMIMMSMEKQPTVGETADIDFFLSSYFVMDSMEIKLNGKSYEVKNGIATFDYTPKSTGTKYFNVDVNFKNPVTGKTDKFSQVEKVEVFE